jgi:hypothetical protein
MYHLGQVTGEAVLILAADEEPAQRIEGYIATERQKHDEYRKPCPRGPLPEDATRVDRMKRKLQTKAGKAVYAARKTIVEPVFTRRGRENQDMPQMRYSCCNRNPECGNVGYGSR